MNRVLQQRILALLLLIVVTLLGGTTHAASTEDIVYYHNDILGNPLAATDESGSVIWQESYTAYGEKTIEDEASDNNPLAFTGHYQDRESGLVYMGARYYSPELGRFLSPDPADFMSQIENDPMQFNRYAYVDNNPYKYTDPTGESLEAIFTDVLPAAGRSFAALALYSNGMINNDQAMINTALEVMHENQVNNLISLAAVVAPPGAGKLYKAAKTTKKGGPEVGGGANLKNLSPGEQKRIQNAADRSGADITVVGSQTTGSRPGSDFDFILEGGTSRSRSKIKNSLPQGPRDTGEGNGRDFHKGPVDKSLPYIKFKPQPKD